MRRTGVVVDWRAGLWSALLCALALTVLAGCRPAPPAEKPADIGALREEIAALEFINALALTPDQTQKLIAALDSVSETLAAARESRTATERELLPLLQQRREALLAGRDVPEDVAGQILKLQHRLDDEPALGSAGESALAGELRGILSPEQARLASGAGQAHSDALEMLAGFRSLPPEAFDNEIGLFAADLASGCEELSASQVEALFREARTFSDEDFVAARDKIAQQLEPAFLPEGETADWLLAQSFAGPRLLQVLREKASTTEKGAPGSG